MGDALQLMGTTTVPWNDVKVDGAVGQSVHYGCDDASVGEVQVAVATVAGKPTKALMHDLWKIRGTRSAMPVVVAAVAANGVYLYTGGTDALPLGPLPHGLAGRQLQAVLDEPNGLAAAARLRAVEDYFRTGANAGFANHYLFASYHLKRDVPKRSDWLQAGERAQEMVPRRGAELIASLGFTSEPAPGGALVLRGTTGQRRAIAVLLDESENFDQKSVRHQLSPVAHGLELARREEVAWVVLMRQSTLRLYPGRDGVGVGQRGQSETYFELDLAMVDPEFSALLPLIFSAEALEPGGSADEILAGSGRYAADLGSKLRDRVYLNVVPALSIAIAERLPQLGITVDAEGLQLAYKLSMRILFRLLFQAYGEATELLPAGRNENYQVHSLRAFVELELTTDSSEFSAEAGSIWRGLKQVWEAIEVGNARWEVPAYGGSLFDRTSPEGALIERLELPDSVLGPALQAMLTELTEDGVPGAVDFRSLQVREFGTIYEGLLESSLSLAETDLIVDRNGVYIPAADGDEPAVRAGQPYFHSASGERKATGSYYTPKIVVDHLIERSVEPALDAHLARVKALMDEGREREAGDLFFDFRVADLAMGSAHFLVAAVDKIERGMRDFLTAIPVPSVRAELQRLAEKAREALGADAQAAEAITEAQLLRRQVARRCIYGLDINPLAVELSRLALWIHTFVPGLPMSSLDHGLVLANSLTGIGTVDEAMDALNATELFEPIIREPLAAAHELLKDYARASEADKSEVARGAEVLAQATAAAAPARAIFDVALAKRLGLPVGEAWDASQFMELAGDPRVREAVDALNPAHLPYLFPEVFERPRPGFDVLVGNPPWEESIVEEDNFWELHRPGLAALEVNVREREIERLCKDRPDLVIELEERKASAAVARRALVKGPYPGMGTGDPDLYKGFAWRNWQTLREGGIAGLVMPLSLWGSKGSAPWRREVLNRAEVRVAFAKNTSGWLFPGVNPGYRVTFVSMRRDSDGSFYITGPITDAGEIRTPPKPVGVNVVALAAADPELCIPAFTAPPDLTLWSKLIVQPAIGDSRLANARTDISCAPATEIHATNDGKKGRALFLDGGLDLDVYNHRNIAEFRFDYGPGPFARVNREAVVEWAQQARKSSYRGARSPFSRRTSEWINDVSTLPLLNPRIAFRDVVHSTNPRKIWFALVPPNTPLTNTAPYLVFRDDNVEKQAYLLGILNSGVLDWFGHLRVNLHLNFFIFYSLPVPSFVEGSGLHKRVASIAASLAVDSDHDWGLWGVLGSPLSDFDERTEAKAELDALVSQLFGLSQEERRVVFDSSNPNRSSFNDVEVHVPLGRES